MKKMKKQFNMSSQIKIIALVVTALTIGGGLLPMSLGLVANAQSPPTFSYASSYPVFTVTTGSGLLPTSNWNVFGAGAHGDNNWEDWIYQP